MIAFLVNTSLAYSHYFKEEYFSSNLKQDAHFIYYKSREEEIKAIKEVVELDVQTIIVCGEDSNTHQVLQAIVGKDVTLGIIPLTYSNSLSFYYQLEKSNEFYVEMINNGKVVESDLIVAQIDQKEKKYGLNIATVGFSAQTVPVLTQRERENLLPFWRRLISQLSKTEKVEATCSFLYNSIKDSFFEVAILNTGLHSGNITLTDIATPFDGLMDIFFVSERPSLMDFGTFCYSKFRNSYKLPLRYIDFHKAETMTMELAKPSLLQIDTVRYDARKVIEFYVLKHAQKILVPEAFTGHKNNSF